MMPHYRPLCDCCGQPVDLARGDICPRCGYPVLPEKEERFLVTAIQDLRRVADHGGNLLSVGQLLGRYQARLAVLRQFTAAATLPTPVLVAPPPPAASMAPVRTPEVPAATLRQPQVPVPPPPVPPQPAGPVFSFRSFFEDQFINIVASLGAFLILVGSLSFVATQTNLLLSFLIMFAVHAVFGGIGIIARRFPGFRIVAGIYTAIFALLLPLVGWAAYRLVAARFLPISTPSLIAITAIYATLAYASLAIYQRFVPFGFLAGVSLIVADLATASSWHLAYWWWPVALLLLAFPLLASVSGRFPDALAILRSPARAIMFTCVGAGAGGLLLIGLYTLLFMNSTSFELRLTLASLALLLLAWFSLFAWLRRDHRWARVLPYFFLLSVLTCAYASNFSAQGYALACVATAWLFHLLDRYIQRSLPVLHSVRDHLVMPAIVLALCIPWIVTPLLPGWIMMGSAQSILSMSGETLLDLLALLAACVLLLSMALHRTGGRKLPLAGQRGWCWLTLPAGFLFTWTYSLVALLVPGQIVWWFLALTLAFVALTVLVRRQVSTIWANPLDLLALLASGLVLLTGLQLRIDYQIAQLFFLLALSYAIALFQRRPAVLLVSCMLALLALPLLSTRPAISFALGLFLPFVAAVIEILVHRNTPDASSVKPWSWPALGMAVLYVTIHILGAGTPFIPGFSLALEIAALALAWYGAAALARRRWWLVGTVCFSLAALLQPGDTFNVLIWLAPACALLAVAVQRLVNRTWAMPLYIVAIVSALVMSFNAFTYGHLLVATWALLAFSVIIYALGIVQDDPVLLWLAPCFATWSIYDAGSLGDLYRPPVAALVCAGLGLAGGALRLLLPSYWESGKRLLRYTLPLYATAVASAVLTGLYGSLAGVNHPFYTAVPDALLLFALVAYAVLLFEKRPRWTPLVTGFAIWGASLALQTTIYYPVAVTIGAALLGLLCGYLFKPAKPALWWGAIPNTLTWSWPWYITALFTSLTVGAWNMQPLIQPVSADFIALSLLVFALLALIIALVSRVPVRMLISAGLVAWAIYVEQLPSWQTVLALSLLCVLFFGARYLWRVVSPFPGLEPQVRVHDWAGLGGQICVVLASILLGGLSSSDTLLAHAGALALFVLAALLYWLGSLSQRAEVLRWCLYTVGLLVSLVVAWEMHTLGITRLDLLAIAPASYLVVVAPFLMRDEVLSDHHRFGQICALLGAALLLLPSLSLSFSNDNLSPTLLLAGESLALFLLGIIARMRTFVLSGAALVIVSAIHALFLPSLAIPPSVALTVIGGTLLALATGLSLARHRLRSAWLRWQ